MMHSSLVMRTALIVGVVTVAAGCAKPPTDQIARAEQALAAAEQAEAPVYAADEWAAAQTAMDTAQAEIAAQQAKFALIRSYTKATELMTAAGDLAQAAEEAGAAGREKARTDAESLLGQIRAGLEAATGLIADLEGCRRRPKGFARDLEMLQGTLQGLQQAVPQVEGAVAGGRFKEAITEATSLGSQVEAFVSDLEAAKAKIGC